MDSYGDHVSQLQQLSIRPRRSTMQVDMRLATWSVFLDLKILVQVFPSLFNWEASLKSFHTSCSPTLQVTFAACIPAKAELTFPERIFFHSDLRYCFIFDTSWRDLDSSSGALRRRRIAVACGNKCVRICMCVRARVCACVVCYMRRGWVELT